MQKGTCLLAMLALAGVVGIAGCSSVQPQVETGATGGDAPVQGMQEGAAVTARLQAFEAKTLQGDPFGPADVASKDVTVVNCWQTTCPPCIAEMPELAELARRLPENVQVVTVCFDGLRKASLVQQIIEDAGWEGVTLVQAGGDLLSYCNRVIEYTPSVFFVAGDGSVVGDPTVGPLSDLEGTYLQRINEVLAWQGKDPVSLAPKG